LTVPLKLCAAFGVDEGAGGFGERRDRQQHVGVVGTVLEGRHHHDHLGLVQRGTRGLRVVAVQFRLGVQQQVGLARLANAAALAPLPGGTALAR
jgi:hypothetical protein